MVILMLSCREASTRPWHLILDQAVSERPGADQASAANIRTRWFIERSGGAVNTLAPASGS
jgi:hypothetical protein